MKSVRNIVAVVFFAIVGMFLIFSALMVHPFGNPNLVDGEEVETKMDDHIIGGINETTGKPYGAQTETGADNAVTSVVFDYRGFDTLGEATVLFTAVAGVMLLFRRRKK